MSSSVGKKRATKETLPKQNKRRTRKTNTDHLNQGIALPVVIEAANSTKDIMTILEKLGGREEEGDLKCPVLIGSRAASFWLPSFHTNGDWNLVTTPKQALSMIKDLQAYSEEKYNQLKISLYQQPLDLNVIKNRNDVSAMLNSLPEYLYTVYGSIKDHFTFKMNIVPVNSQARDHNTTQETALMPGSSWFQLLNLCNASQEDNQSYFSFPVDPNTSHPCVVAGIIELEALLCCKVHWPTDFENNMIDLHSLRCFMTSTCQNIGIRAAKDKPLDPPEQPKALRSFIKTRTLEMEGYLGTPNDLSDDDAFTCESAQSSSLQHSELHSLVKYDNVSIVDNLKQGRTKQVISKASFQEATYQTQLNCVKEEAMVIALDHFLVPGYSNDTNQVYISSLSHLCTYIAKGVFKEFIINNYPRLDRCDKDLDLIKNEIIAAHPSTSTPAEEDISTRVLKDSAFDLQDLNIVKQLVSLTKETTLRSIGQRVSRLKKKEQQDHPVETAVPEASNRRRGGRNYGGPYSFNKSTENFWTIDSTLPDKESLIIGFIKNHKFGQEEYMGPEYSHHGTICVLPLNAHADTSALKKYRPRTGEWYGSTPAPDDSFAKIGLSSSASCSTVGVWSHSSVQANTLVAEVGHLGISGLNQDLFMLYLLSLVQPSLSGSGEDPFKEEVNDAKCRGLIPLTPEHHLWYDLWKLHLQK